MEIKTGSNIEFHTMEVLNERKSQEVYKLLNSLKKSGNIKIGMNQSIKSLNAGNALIIIIAKDSIPEALVAPLPVLCEQKGVQYVVVDSKTALGKACGLEIDVLSCSISVAKHEDATKLQDKISKTLK